MPMVPKTQLWLPKFKKVKRAKRTRKLPQPKVGKVRVLKKFELLHRPFDLRFRGRINKWLGYIKARKDIDFEEILDKFQLKIVKLYFYPQKENNKWLNQEEVLEKIELNSKKKLRKALVDTLCKVWAKAK